VLAGLFSELVDGAAAEGGPFILNPGDVGLLRSLETISAADASRAVNDGATIAAHAQHVRYGLSLMNRWAREGGDPFAGANWDEAWKTLAVDTATWNEIRGGLRDQAHEWLQVLQSPRDMTTVEVAGMAGSVAHLAYHLGAIKQISKSARGPRQGATRIAGLILAVAFGTAAAVSAQAPTTERGRALVLRACVKAGIDPGSIVLNQVFELRGGQVIRPALAGPVVYWLNDSRPLQSHVGHMVVVTGTVQGVRRTEADIQRKDGALIVELEGPGNDVETTLDAVPEVVGTAGRRDDVPTTQIRVDVRQVSRSVGSCV
jgi:hypothetical protein